MTLPRPIKRVPLSGRSTVIWMDGHFKIKAMGKNPHISCDRKRIEKMPADTKHTQLILLFCATSTTDFQTFFDFYKIILCSPVLCYLFTLLMMSPFAKC
jgi:hypothetical protein